MKVQGGLHVHCVCLFLVRSEQSYQIKPRLINVTNDMDYYEYIVIKSLKQEWIFVFWRENRLIHSSLLMDKYSLNSELNCTLVDNTWNLERWLFNDYLENTNILVCRFTKSAISFLFGLTHKCRLFHKLGENVQCKNMDTHGFSFFMKDIAPSSNPKT